MPAATKGGVVRRRPTEILSGSAAAAAAIALLGLDQQTAAAIAGAMALVPAGITWYVTHFGSATQRGVAAQPRAYAPALDEMYAHLAHGLGRALAAPGNARKTSAHLALLSQAAGVVSVLDPRLANTGLTIPAPAIDDESETDEPEVEVEEEPVAVDAPAEEEGGAPEVIDEPAAARPRRPRRRPSPATV